MSEVKRFFAALGFDPEPYVDMIEDGDGTYVYYEDYEALRAQLADARKEIERLNISLELQADRVDKLIDENVKAEAENAALRARLKGVEEVEEYKNHEFCKDVECTALEYNTCSPVICHKTAKHFHKWLKQHGYKIVKVASIV